MGEMGDVDERCLVVNIRGESGMVCVCANVKSRHSSVGETGLWSWQRERPPYLVEY